MYVVKGELEKFRFLILSLLLFVCVCVENIGEPEFLGFVFVLQKKKRKG